MQKKIVLVRRYELLSSVQKDTGNRVTCHKPSCILYSVPPLSQLESFMIGQGCIALTG